MIENVERFRAEFKRRALLYGEMLVERHVEIDLMRVPRNIPRSIAKGESLGSSKGRWIHEQRAKDVRGVPRGDCAIRVADKIRTRPCADSVGNTCVVSGNRHRGAVVRASVGNIKRRSGLKRSDTGILPASQERMRQAVSFKER